MRSSCLAEAARIAARIADLAHSAEQQRQGELDEYTQALYAMTARIMFCLTDLETESPV